MRSYVRKMRATGSCPPRQSHRKILWSWLGAFLGILAISLAGKYLRFSATEELLLIGSLGASAVLVYGAPAADFSQPRNMIGGHVISAFIGVAIFQVMKDHPTAVGALAVSLAIAAMHLTRCLHPPGGATALIAVNGGERIHSLGYNYVLCPVLLGATVLLLVALLINNLSSNPERHYPVYWL